MGWGNMIMHALGRAVRNKMKRIIKVIVIVVVIILSLTFALAGCDLVRKVQGIETKFQKKVQNADKLSFDMALHVESDGSVSELNVSCYKDGNEYAYTFYQPDSPTVVHRRLFADECLYEFITKTTLHVGSYYTYQNVPYTCEDNLLYWVTQKIMLATYATLLSTGHKDKVNGVDTYRYDFDYKGDNYHLWYDDANLVKISATFHSSDESGQAHVETYTAVFTNYSFGSVAQEPFQRPDQLSGAVYVESPISFESWMAILGQFTLTAENWLS